MLIPRGWKSPSPWKIPLPCPHPCWNDTPSPRQTPSRCHCDSQADINEQSPGSGPKCHVGRGGYFRRGWNNAACILPRIFANFRIHSILFCWVNTGQICGLHISAYFLLIFAVWRKFLGMVFLELNFDRLFFWDVVGCVPCRIYGISVLSGMFSWSRTSFWNPRIPDILDIGTFCDAETRSRWIENVTQKTKQTVFFEFFRRRRVSLPWSFL